MRRSRVLVVIALLGSVVGAVPPSASAATVVSETVARIGTSVQGRPIVAVHRWTDPAAHPTLVIGNMHGEELAGQRVVAYLRTADLPPGVNLWLVPTLNPDGSRIHRRDNAHGVDLNRNFPTYFLRSDAGTTKWSGPSPASEPEVRAMMGFLRSTTPWTILSFHQPLHAVDRYRAKSMTLVRRLSALFGLPIKPLDCHGGCHGTMTDWYNSHYPGRAVTTEFGYTPSQAKIDRVARGILQVAATS